MPRLRYLLLEFLDGSTERTTGTRYRVFEGVLTLSTDGYYGLSKHKSWPLTNIKSFQWEDE